MYDYLKANFSVFRDSICWEDGLNFGDDWRLESPASCTESPCLLLEVSDDGEVAWEVGCEDENCWSLFCTVKVCVKRDTF